MKTSLEDAVSKVENTLKSTMTYTDPLNPHYHVVMNLHLACQNLIYGPKFTRRALKKLELELAAIGAFKPYDNEAGKDRLQERRDQVVEHLTQHIIRTRPDLDKLNRQRLGMK